MRDIHMWRMRCWKFECNPFKVGWILFGVLSVRSRVYETDIPRIGVRPVLESAEFASGDPSSSFCDRVLCA